MHRVHIPTELPLCMPPLVVGKEENAEEQFQNLLLSLSFGAIGGGGGRKEGEAFKSDDGG